MFHSIWALIVAAGASRRLKNALGSTPKQFFMWEGRPLYWRSALAFSACVKLAGVVFVFPEASLELEEKRIREMARQDNFGLEWKTAAGGSRRQDSTFNGLKEIPLWAEKVLVHDAARPFLKPALINELIAKLQAPYDGVIPYLPATDTIKVMRSVDDPVVQETLNRERLALIQTPQIFYGEALRKAHENAIAKNIEATDDAQLVETLGGNIALIPGDRENIKITNAEDLKRLTEDASLIPCTGFGYDVHKYGGERPLIIGGIAIPGGYSVYAHSDGDVLLHALMDAILGCAALGDIGRLFPDQDPAYEDVSSAILFDEVMRMARKRGVEPCHMDMTVVCQKPRLAPFADQIKKNISRLSGLFPDDINFKASTEEGLGFTGKVEGIKAYACVTAQRKRQR